MKSLFAKRGLIRTGRRRCDHCRDRWLGGKRIGADGKPGLIVQCKQSAPNKNCAQCSIDGVSCSKRVSAGDTVKTRRGGYEWALGMEALSENLDDVVDRLTPRLENNEQITLSKAEWNLIVDKATGFGRAVAEMKVLSAEIPDSYDDDDLRRAKDNNGRDVEMWKFVGK